MKIYRLERDQVVPRPIEETFAFFADAANLEAITPPWLRFQFPTAPPVEMRKGALIQYRLRWRGLPMRWLTRIEEWEESQRFQDVQLRGPYRLWVHQHTFEVVPGGTRMRDVATYALPFGPLGLLAHALLIGRDLERIFDYRAARIAELLQDTHQQPARAVGRPRSEVTPPGFGAAPGDRLDSI
jgi:ligand-binding SRPBCC domain-containing protein